MGTLSETNQLALRTWVKLARAANSVSATVRAALMRAGLTDSQFGVLEVLYSKGPLCQRAIGEKILKTSGNITLVIDNLEKNGLVVRQRDTSDRRMINVSLTDAGYQVIHNLFSVHADGVATAMSVLSVEEQRELGRLCRKLGKGNVDGTNQSSKVERQKHEQG